MYKDLFSLRGYYGVKSSESINHIGISNGGGQYALVALEWFKS